MRFMGSQRVGCTVVRRSAHDRETRCEVHTVLEGKSLERSESLVVIHSQYGIIFRIVCKSEESVRRVWTEGHNSLLVRLLYCRDDDVLLLVTEKSAVTAVRVETENGDLWRIDTEIPDK